MKALKQCPHVEVGTHNEVRVLMKGDEVVVKIWLKEGKVHKKDVNALTKQVILVISSDEVSLQRGK